jgi:hypothetical protein
MVLVHVVDMEIRTPPLEEILLVVLLSTVQSPKDMGGSKMRYPKS